MTQPEKSYYSVRLPRFQVFTWTERDPDGRLAARGRGFWLGRVRVAWGWWK